MRMLYWAAAVYTALGLASGLYYRELTKAHDFTGRTELSTVHTHLLALGTLMFLVFLALERLLTLTASRGLFAGFFWTYNAGLLITVTAMTIIGTRTVLGEGESKALSGIAGLGHIALTAAFVLFFIVLGERISPSADESSAPTEG